MEIFLWAVKTLRVIQMSWQTFKAPAKMLWIHCIQDKTTETGIQPSQQSKTPTRLALTNTETKTLPWLAHRNTGKRRSTVTLPTQTNTNVRNANTPTMLGLKATASLTWWRKGPIRKKAMRQMTRRNQTIMSWQNCSRNLVGFLCTNPGLFGEITRLLTVFLLLILHGLQVSTVWCSMTPSWSPPTLTMFLWRQKPTEWPEMPWKPLRFLASSAGCPSIAPLLHLQGTQPHTHTLLLCGALLKSFKKEKKFFICFSRLLSQKTVWTKEEFTPGCTSCTKCPYSKQMQGNSRGYDEKKCSSCFSFLIPCCVTSFFSLFRMLLS